MARVFLMSYATPNFEVVRQELNATAVQYGISDHISYIEKDLLASKYYQHNKSVLDEVCGAGYWAWKPHFILEALDQLAEGDMLFYCDAGSAFVDSPAPLIRLCTSCPSGLVLFDARPLTNRQFTKRDCFVAMNCDAPNFWESNEVIATILVLRKCATAISIVREWQSYCCDRRAITDDPNILGKPNLRGYLQHRWDQAILSVLAVKHSIETFRNPTVWGNYLKLPEFRVSGELVPSPYDLIPTITGYSDLPQVNSSYGTLFVINRQPNLTGKQKLTVPQQSELMISKSRTLHWLRKQGAKLQRVFT
jgi:hypothetical protein